MRIFVPYTEMQPATQIALRHWVYTPVNVSKLRYINYWRQRWREGETFINVEHDVVPWFGALEQLAVCDQPWCAYEYDDANSGPATARPYLHPTIGCVKFGAEAIKATPNLFDPDPAYVESLDRADDWYRDFCLSGWIALDRLINFVLLRAGFSVHYHGPPVLNANPLILLSEEERRAIRSANSRRLAVELGSLPGHQRRNAGSNRIPVAARKRKRGR